MPVATPCTPAVMPLNTPPTASTAPARGAGATRLKPARGGSPAWVRPLSMAFASIVALPAATSLEEPRSEVRPFCGEVFLAPLLLLSAAVSVTAGTAPELGPLAVADRATELTGPCPASGSASMASAIGCCLLEAPAGTDACMKRPLGLWVSPAGAWRRPLGLVIRAGLPPEGVEGGMGRPSMAPNLLKPAEITLGPEAPGGATASCCVCSRYSLRRRFAVSSALAGECCHSTKDSNASAHCGAGGGMLSWGGNAVEVAARGLQRSSERCL